MVFPQHRTLCPARPVGFQGDPHDCLAGLPSQEQSSAAMDSRTKNQQRNVGRESQQLLMSTIGVAKGRDMITRKPATSGTLQTPNLRPGGGGGCLAKRCLWPTESTKTTAITSFWCEPSALFFVCVVACFCGGISCCRPGSYRVRKKKEGGL